MYNQIGLKEGILFCQEKTQEKNFTIQNQIQHAINYVMYI